MKRMLLIASMALAIIFSSTTNASTAKSDILTTAAQNGSFNTLVSLVVAAELDGALQGKGHFTVFAPTDEAFEKLPAETLAALRKDPKKLAEILKYHVVTQTLSVPKHPPSHPLKSIKTLGGPELRFERNGTELKINQANLIARNIKCSNGVIQVIDSVLMPPVDDNSIVGVATKAGKFKTLLAAAKAAGLAETLAGDGPWTVFAPTDEAFAKISKKRLGELLKPENKSQLQNILKYHVIKGKVNAQQAVKAASAKTIQGSNVKIAIKSGRLSINEASVIANDVEAGNGIIHIIDSVLMPPMDRTSQTSRENEDITITANWSKSVNRDGLVANRITVRCTGGGSVNLTNLKANEIITSVSGGAKVQLAGTTKSHQVRVSGGGVLSASKLVTDETDVSVNGGGTASVNATKTLEATALAGATLSYVDNGMKLIKKSINKYATLRPISASWLH